LESFITNKQNEVHHMYTALFEKLEVMGRPFALVYTNDFTG